jgi:hypothetical protein
MECPTLTAETAGTICRIYGLPATFADGRELPPAGATASTSSLSAPVELFGCPAHFVEPTAADLTIDGHGLVGHPILSTKELMPAPIFPRCLVQEAKLREDITPPVTVTSASASALRAISPCRWWRETGRRRGMGRGTGRGQGRRVRHRRIPAHVGSCLAAGSAVRASPDTILQATAAVADHAAVVAAARGRATDLAASTGRVGTDAVHARPSRRAVAAFKHISASVTNQSTVPLCRP